MLQIRQQILNGFKSCGYRNSLLRESYSYFDGKKNRSAEIVGFHQPIYNSSTACIAAIDKTKLNGKKIKTELSPYQLLGCPVLLVYDNSGLQFWKNSGIQIALHGQIESKKINGFFSKYRKEFAPESIYRAKTISRVRKNYQLSFADIGGLMGIIEEKEGKYLSELTERIIKSLKVNCRGIKEDGEFDKWLFQAGFWLIGAKILKDKQVEKFKTLKISNIDDLVERVKKHYSASESLNISNTIQRDAFKKVAETIVEPVSSFAHLTTESLAYVYENSLTSKETRKILGTHATPSWLVNYIVWELIDWIEAIPQKDRIILEPACGHAPFLTAGAKLLSSPLIYKGKEEDRHRYLKEHLIGIDKDSFAEEIARLALTLADIPNPNGWNIQHSDVYENDILKKAAQKTTILFCNPPFENFSLEEQQIYGNSIETGNKAAEVLARILPYLPEKAVFGVILPHGFLNKKSLFGLRKYILDNCELRTICNLPESGVFGKSKHPVTVLLGRKFESKENISYIRVDKSCIKAFKNTYSVSEEKISKKELYEAEDLSFLIPELNDIWQYCKKYDKLKSIVGIGKGLIYKGKDLPSNAITISNTKRKGFIAGFDSFGTDIKITELPQKVFLNLDKRVILRPSWGTTVRHPQVLMNYTRVGSGHWRLKAWLDIDGHPVTSNFLVGRPKDSNKWSINCVWALLNSPYANAFAYCHNPEKSSNSAGMMRKMPVPKISDSKKDLIDNLVLKYFSILKPITTGLIPSNVEKKAKSILLKIDAEILCLYDLPPRLEKELLDFFEGVQRKGVDFKFDRYHPEGFDAYIPLHIFISDEFQNSSVENVKKWIESNRTPEVIEAFKAAVKVKK
jgi:hypothetical protein